jgi:hypothetical protein
MDKRQQVFQLMDNLGEKRPFCTFNNSLVTAALIPRSLQLSGKGKVSEPRLMSQMRRMRKVVCA